MATFDTSDDERELEEIRNRLLGGNRREEASSTVAGSLTRRPATSSVATPPPAQDGPATHTEPPRAPDVTPDVASASTPVESAPSAVEPPRSFMSARPRSSGPAPRPEPAPRPSVPQSTLAADATPGDVEVDEPASEMAEPTPTPPPAEPLSPVALKELSRALGGVSVDQLQQALAQNPQLLAGGPAETATAPTVHPTSAPEADAPTVSPAPNDKTLANADLATQGWRAWLVKLGIPMRKGATERFADMMEMVNAVIRRDLGRPIVVGVSSYRGGSGKTSAAVLMARLLAEIRGESVIVLDTDLFGTLVTRSVGDDQDARGGSVTMASLAAALRTSGGDVTRMVRDGGNGYVFVPGSTTFRANEIDPDGYRMIIEAVRQVYPIVLVDMAVVDDAPLYHAVLESLDGLVMMSPTVTGGVGFLYRTQTELQHRGVDHLNDHRISALNNLAAGRSEVDIADFARGLKVRDQRDVVEIPYDRHLAESTMIDMAKLSASTKTAFTLTLAALIDTFDGQKTN